MISAGFKLLTYGEVIALAHQGNTVDNAAVWSAAVKARAEEKESKKPSKFMNVCTSDGYYDEFPDAYGQSL